MKYIGIITFVLLSFAARAQSDLYNIAVSPIDGNQLGLSSLSGKRIVFLAYGGPQYGARTLVFLDSLQRANVQNLYVVVTPALDFDSTLTPGSIRDLKDSLHLQVCFTQPSWVTKRHGSDQMPLYQWLTVIGRNTHFDRDVEGEGQLFVVNQSGILYSVIEKSMFEKGISKVIAP